MEPSKLASTNLPAEICLKSTRPNPSDSLRLFIFFRRLRFSIRASKGKPLEPQHGVRVRRILDCTDFSRVFHLTQSCGSGFGCDVPLRSAQHLKTNHKFAHSCGAQ
jgi:hypothetical protein